MTNNIIGSLVMCMVLMLLSCSNGNEDNSTSYKIVKSKKAESKSSATKETKKASQPIPQKQIDKASSIISTVSQEEIENIDASRIFKMRCASCHGLKGNMNVNGAKDLTQATITIEESIAQIYFGKGLMLPHKNMLSEAEIIAVAKYVEQEFR